MPTYFQRPENALKRANEFIDVGKKQRALDALYDVIKSKKHRTWQKIHEPIMEKYLQLCVELRKSHIAKEGLYQYKNICQQVNIKSLEDVVRKYIQLAEEKCEAARAESHQVVLDVDDLDEPNKPESLLLKAVSGEDTQDRTDRAILTPWVKFLWESYRQCLDLLRNNSRVEELYQDLAQQAFKFCLKYGRKTEFRKLCDNLRTHLSHVHKHQHQQTAINLNNPASQAMHLETRLVQLDSAINMELWQEAFKAVEDIHGLIQLSKKAPRPSLMANYYQKLGLVFWKSGNPLFHASTLHRLFHLSKEQRKNLSPEELQRMASRVLCATLAVPIPASRNAIDALLEMEESTVEKTKRLATLLMLQTPPNRQGLIKDIAKYGVVQHVHPELQNLYRNLEVEFHPLRLYTRVKSSIEFITQNDELAQYVPALEDIIVTRVLRQVSQVYQTIEFSRFAALVPFTTKFRLERIIVNAAKMLELQVRIDHRNSSLSFGTDLGVAHKEEVPEGPYIQSMPSEQIRNQLTFMASALHKAITILQPKEHKVQREELKSQIVNSYKLTAKKEHTRILERRQIIENRKEELEHLNEEREQQEYHAQEVQRKRALELEMARLEREAQERELQRRQEETKEIQKRHAMERIEQLKKSDLGAKVVQNMDEEDLANMDVEDIMAKQVEHLEREKRELRERLKNQERKIDYMVRARRLAEIPILEKLYEEEKVKDREFWEKQEIERIERMKEARKLELETRDRLLRMRGDRMEFMEQIMERRKKTYKDKVADFEKKLAEEHKKRLLDRKVKRKEERRQKYIKEKEEEEQRIRDEALLREHEEKERLEQEMQEEREREYREKIEKLEQQAAKQLAREREIEEREAKKRESDHREVERVREEHRVPVRSDAARSEPEEWRRGESSETTEKKAWRPSPSDGGGWRERVKEKQESWKKDLDDGHGEDETWRRTPADKAKEKISARDFPDRAQLRRDPDRSPTRGDADIPLKDERDRPTPRVDRERPLPRDDRDRRLLRDEVDRPPVRDDRDRLPLRDNRDRQPLKDDRDRPPLRDSRDRPPLRDDRPPLRDDRPSFRDDRDRPTLRDSRDFRESPRDDRDRGLPRDDRERRRSPGGGGGGGPWRDRVPVRGDREGGRDSWRDRAPPREDAWRDRGTPRDDRDKRIDERDKRFDDKERRGGDRWGSRDERGVREEGSWRSREGGRDDAWRDRAPDRERNWGRDDMRDRRDDRGRRDDMPDKKDDRERNPPRDRDDRDDSWRKGETLRETPAKEGGRWRDRDSKPPEKQDKDKREEPEDDGWTTVRYN